MTEQSANVLSRGAGKNGLGQINAETCAVLDFPYTSASRFGDDRRSTNPVNILAVADAVCFTMAFSHACEEAALARARLDTRAPVELSTVGKDIVIDRIALNPSAIAPGLDEAWCQEIAVASKRDCPLIRALASVAEIPFQATLARRVQ